MLILVVSGSLTLKIAGLDRVVLQEEHAIVCPAKYWLRAIDASRGHVLTLIYGPQVCHAPSDSRVATSRSLDVPQPGVRDWLRQTKKKQENEKEEKANKACV